MSIAASTPNNAHVEDNDNKFLTFRLGEEEYGVEILRVREIIGLIDVTPLPRTPDYVKGVINLRGKIIPVIDLRTKFGLPAVDYTEATCVIGVEVTTSDDEQFQMGVIVDTVSEVLDIAPSQIEPAPRFGCSLSSEYIMGMGKVEHAGSTAVTILLDIDRVMTDSETRPILQPEANADEATKPHTGAASAA